MAGGDVFQIGMPSDLREALPSQLTKTVVSGEGETLKPYSNGRRLFTLSDRLFARTRVLPDAT